MGKNWVIHSKKLILVEVLFLLLFYFGIILFSSPIFRVMGYEYASITSIVVSFLAGILSAFECGPGNYQSFRKSTQSLLLPIFTLLAIPFTLSLLSTLFIPNCALSDGIIFYVTVAVPGVLLGGQFGSVFGLIFEKRFWRVAGFIAFWIATFLLSLVPGYTNPQIFTYGWQYGFFPGFVWDSALELSRGYYYFRVENFILADLLLNSAILYRRWKDGLPNRSYWLSLTFLTIAMSAGVLSHDRLRITSDHERVESYLSGKSTSDPGMPNFVIRYRPGSLSPEEIQQLKENVFWDLHDLRERLGLKDSSRQVTVYLYPSTDAMEDYVGTGSASISKPWLSEVHIAKENLTSLKHELTHVVLREVGAWPFYISWSTGLTEGIAMAQEDRYDGLRTLDEQAARILQMHLASGVKNVMSFSGFASNASQKSYVLAGSFASYLLRAYGVTPYIRLYTSLDYEKEYHRSLAELESAWISSLKSYRTPMDRFDSLRTEYFFGGTSIISEPCLRRIGKLEKMADERMQAKNYLGADSIYAVIVHESGSVSALLRRGIALMDAGEYTIADTVLSRVSGLDAVKVAESLTFARADAAFRDGDTSRALENFHEAIRQRTNDRSMLASYLFARVLPDRLSIGSANQYKGGWKEYLDTLYRGASPQTKIDVLATILNSSTTDSLRQYYEYLYASALIAKGEYSLAVPYLEKVATLRAQSLEDSLLVFEAGLQLMTFSNREIPLSPPAFMRNAANLEIAELTRRRDFLRSWKKTAHVH